MLSGRNGSIYSRGFSQQTSRERKVISKLNMAEQDLGRARAAMVRLERQEVERAMREDVHNTVFGDDVVAVEAEPVCAICLENKCVLASQECGHVCLCFACARMLIEKGDIKCPKCRVAIRKRLQRVYF